MGIVSARDIRLIVSDVDGVWTDGKIIYSGEQREIKEFNVRDGLAAKLAQKAGITVALLTSRRSPALERRARELGIHELLQGATNKFEELRNIAKRLDVQFEEILYAGDDLPDLAAMARAGISAAPSDAAPEVRERASWKLESRGGAGAFRELVERLLRERGEWDALVEEFTRGRPPGESV
ncbi:MAG TPA: HAD family hydrolase [Thermoanaerobaculia bacterium]|nr:HAD family hydrolase [Thermoanaerobaculia bacterium]